MEKQTDLSTVLGREHERKWVALTRDYRNVVAASDTLVALKRQVGDKDVVYLKVPSSEVVYSY